MERIRSSNAVPKTPLPFNARDLYTNPDLFPSTSGVDQHSGSRQDATHGSFVLLPNGTMVCQSVASSSPTRYLAPSSLPPQSSPTMPVYSPSRPQTQPQLRAPIVATAPQIVPIPNHTSPVSPLALASPPPPFPSASTTLRKPLVASPKAIPTPPPPPTAAAHPQKSHPGSALYQSLQKQTTRTATPSKAVSDSSVAPSNATQPASRESVRTTHPHSSTHTARRNSNASAKKPTSSKLRELEAAMNEEIDRELEKLQIEKQKALAHLGAVSARKTQQQPIVLSVSPHSKASPQPQPLPAQAAHSPYTSYSPAAAVEDTSAPSLADTSPVLPDVFAQLFANSFEDQARKLVEDSAQSLSSTNLATENETALEDGAAAEMQLGSNTGHISQAASRDGAELIASDEELILTAENLLARSTDAPISDAESDSTPPPSVQGVNNVENAPFHAVEERNNDTPISVAGTASAETIEASGTFPSPSVHPSVETSHPSSMTPLTAAPLTTALASEQRRLSPFDQFPDLEDRIEQAFRALKVTPQQDASLTEVSLKEASPNKNATPAQPPVSPLDALPAVLEEAEEENLHALLLEHVDKMHQVEYTRQLRSDSLHLDDTSAFPQYPDSTTRPDPLHPDVCHASPTSPLRRSNRHSPSLRALKSSPHTLPSPLLVEIRRQRVLSQFEEDIFETDAVLSKRLRSTRARSEYPTVFLPSGNHSNPLTPVTPLSLSPSRSRLGSPSPSQRLMQSAFDIAALSGSGGSRTSATVRGGSSDSPFTGVHPGPSNDFYGIGEASADGGADWDVSNAADRVSDSDSDSDLEAAADRRLEDSIPTSRRHGRLDRSLFESLDGIHALAEMSSRLPYVSPPGTRSRSHGDALTNAASDETQSVSGVAPGLLPFEEFERSLRQTYMLIQSIVETVGAQEDLETVPQLLDKLQNTPLHTLPLESKVEDREDSEEAVHQVSPESAGASTEMNDSNVQEGSAIHDAEDGEEGEVTFSLAALQQAHNRIRSRLMLLQQQQNGSSAPLESRPPTEGTGRKEEASTTAPMSNEDSAQHEAGDAEEVEKGCEEADTAATKPEKERGEFEFTPLPRIQPSPRKVLPQVFSSPLLQPMLLTTALSLTSSGSNASIDLSSSMQRSSAQPENTIVREPTAGTGTESDESEGDTASSGLAQVATQTSTSAAADMGSPHPIRTQVASSRALSACQAFFFQLLQEFQKLKELQNETLQKAAELEAREQRRGNRNPDEVQLQESVRTPFEVPSRGAVTNASNTATAQERSAPQDASPRKSPLVSAKTDGMPLSDSVASASNKEIQAQDDELTMHTFESLMHQATQRLHQQEEESPESSTTVHPLPPLPPPTSSPPQQPPQQQQYTPFTDTASPGLLYRYPVPPATPFSPVTHTTLAYTPLPRATAAALDIYSTSPFLSSPRHTGTPLIGASGHAHAYSGIHGSTTTGTTGTTGTTTPSTTSTTAGVARARPLYPQSVVQAWEKCVDTFNRTRDLSSLVSRATRNHSTASTPAITTTVTTTTTTTNPHPTMAPNSSVSPPLPPPPPLPSVSEAAKLVPRTKGTSLSTAPVDAVPPATSITPTTSVSSAAPLHRGQSVPISDRETEHTRSRQSQRHAPSARGVSSKIQTQTKRDEDAKSHRALRLSRKPKLWTNGTAVSRHQPIRVDSEESVHYASEIARNEESHAAASVTTGASSLVKDSGSVRNFVRGRLLRQEAFATNHFEILKRKK